MPQTEFKYLQRSIAAGTAAPQIHDLTMVGDRLTRWQFKLKDFDADVPGWRLATGVCCQSSRCASSCFFDPLFAIASVACTSGRQRVHLKHIKHDVASCLYPLLPKAWPSSCLLVPHPALYRCP